MSCIVFHPRTNITEPHTRNYTTSRGALTTAFLLPPKLTTLEEHISSLVAPPSIPYAGFNLLLLSVVESGSPGLSYEAAVVSNCGGGGQLTGRMVEQDNDRVCEGISNGVCGKHDPPWKKVADGVQMLEEILRQNPAESELIEDMFKLLRFVSSFFSLLPQPASSLTSMSS